MDILPKNFAFSSANMVHPMRRFGVNVVFDNSATLTANPGAATVNPAGECERQKTLNNQH
jgi:hypothetical protein